MVDVSVLYQISDISFLRSTYTKKRRNFTVKILLYIYNIYYIYIVNLLFAVFVMLAIKTDI